jgi:hypothetical protein
MTVTSMGHGTATRTTPSLTAARLCVFCGVMGLALYVSTVIGADHVFYNAFGMDHDPHALRNAAVIFIATAWTNLVSVMDPDNDALRLSARVVSAIVCLHYVAETFVWHHLNWLTTLFVMAFLGVVATVGVPVGRPDA